MADTPELTADEVNLTVTIPRELFDRLTAAGKERLCSKSVVAAFLLADGLDRLVPVAELLRTSPPPPWVAPARARPGTLGPGATIER